MVDLNVFITIFSTSYSTAEASPFQTTQSVIGFCLCASVLNVIIVPKPKKQLDFRRLVGNSNILVWLIRGVMMNSYFMVDFFLQILNSCLIIRFSLLTNLSS